MGGPTGHLATIQPLRCQGETRQRYASSGPQGARQRRPQVSDTPTIRLAGIHPCPAAGPARQPGDCPLCPREEIVSTDFEEKILLIFVTRGNSSPHITGQTSWRLRRKGGLGKKTQIKRERVSWKIFAGGGGGGGEMHSCKFVTVGRSVRLSRHLHTFCQQAPQRRLSGC